MLKRRFLTSINAIMNTTKNAQHFYCVSWKLKFLFKMQHGFPFYAAEWGVSIVAQKNLRIYKRQFMLNFWKHVSKPKAMQILVIIGYSKRHVNEPTRYSCLIIYFLM